MNYYDIDDETHKIDPFKLEMGAKVRINNEYPDKELGIIGRIGEIVKIYSDSIYLVKFEYSDHGAYTYYIYPNEIGFALD